MFSKYWIPFTFLLLVTRQCGMSLISGALGPDSAVFSSDDAG